MLSLQRVGEGLCKEVAIGLTAEDESVLTRCFWAVRRCQEEERGETGQGRPRTGPLPDAGVCLGGQPRPMARRFRVSQVFGFCNSETGMVLWTLNSGTCLRTDCITALVTAGLRSWGRDLSLRSERNSEMQLNLREVGRMGVSIQNILSDFRVLSIMLGKGIMATAQSFNFS